VSQKSSPSTTGDRQGVSSYMPQGPDICCGFVSILNLNIGFPNFGERGAFMVEGISGVGKGVSELLQAVYIKS